jgi:hypothetical protein
MSNIFGKNAKTLNLTKIHHVVEIVLFGTDGRTDGSGEIKSRFSQLPCNTPYNVFVNW